MSPLPIQKFMKIKTQTVSHARSNLQHVVPHFQRSPPGKQRKRDGNLNLPPSQRGASYENRVGKQKQRLDTHVFEFYLENLWKSFSEDKKTSFTYLDCLWFSLYKEESTKTKVLTWIKKKNVFSRKYVFVPIVCWHHWSLLILCHLGESLESKTRTPCMLLLDSLEMTNPKRLEPDIRKFLLDIYRAEERPEREDLILKIPLLVPKVPQQRNGDDCGIFVLYFINLFIEDAPENFSIFEGYPYFMRDNWFSTTEHFENFCKDVRSSCWKKKRT
ncbi:probable ubiquitin-like-specific protease 2A isoform X5 [Telopea speciosissima]|uniref:probable ubiquitin-like-specific protease 2A isoform X5 n=1 Tax=Telopea speciosissima TaxID=54955 RepID=UPI001CC79BC6|nr:probable ubiquitin-like-specific protease 2A isoform X5 [Telopea speciosissima]